MIKYFTNVISFLIVFPIVATFIVYYISTKFQKNKWRSIHQTVNWTTLLYIVATMILMQMTFGHSFFAYFIVIIICILAVIIIRQWNTKTKIVISLAIKKLWRICFLLFFVFYICLVCFGIFRRLFGS